MGHSLRTNITQKLKQHPWLFQSARLLQLPALSLQAEVQSLLTENPVLEEIQDLQATFFSASDPFTDLLEVTSAPKSLREHLMLQLELSHLSDLEKAVCIGLMDYIQENGYLKKELFRIQSYLQNAIPQLRLETIQTVFEALQSFEAPEPLLATQTDYLIPDLITMKQNKQWGIKLNESLLPKLKINAYYQEIRKTIQAPDPKSYLTEKIKEARWLIQSLKHRAETLLQVGACIIEKQLAFLEYGERAMIPLTLKEIAKPLGLHPSTLSRATQNKYIATPRGTFALKYFFPNKLVSKQTSYSALQIQTFILDSLKTESKLNPLTDQALVEALKTQGITLARRTIAKYRKALGIPIANQRKQKQRS